jgi:hypothetical protein
MELTSLMQRKEDLFGQVLEWDRCLNRISAVVLLR